MDLTAPILIHRAAGHPAPKGHKLTPQSGPCAWCGAETGTGVPLPALAQIGMRAHIPDASATHACAACAWLIADPKRHHRGLLAWGETLLWPVIAPDNATDERPTWWDALRRLAAEPAETLCVCVLTADPKPRKWHHAPLVCRGGWGCYLHSADHDLSAPVSLDLDALLALAERVADALDAGYSKRKCWGGLLHDHERLAADPARALALEAALSPHRGLPLLAAAVLIAHRRP